MAKKKKETEFNVRCYDCHHAVLHQWDNNPVVAYCNKLKTREVAKTPRKCEGYKESKKEPEIIKLTHFK